MPYETDSLAVYNILGLSVFVANKLSLRLLSLEDFKTIKQPRKNETSCETLWRFMKLEALQ